MTRNVDDVHCTDTAFTNAMERFEQASIDHADKEKLEEFFRALRREGLAKTTLV